MPIPKLNSPVYTPEDVALAIRHGVDGVLISNHGGRQLNGIPATLDALRDCGPVARGKIKIAVDGGIRRGTDILKVLALGSDYCFAGRIPIWGLVVCVNLDCLPTLEDQRVNTIIYSTIAIMGVKLAVDLLYKKFKMTMSLAWWVSIRTLFPSRADHYLLFYTGARQWKTSRAHICQSYRIIESWQDSKGRHSLWLPLVRLLDSGQSRRKHY